ncbi:hypothetical protein [Pontibacter vulgaris]|uniref:hypothetical protein n=1 Tax=Pontibacter vulgaris TaxID=2905679 RepID=UPI001FA74EED|nr:hypothetical protein [Pontibacter vulgaris]
MSANNMSDEELDELFRKSAANYDPPFDEEAWSAMDRKLDGTQHRFAGLKRILPVLLLALLVSIVMIWQITERPEVPTRQIPANNEMAMPAITGKDDQLNKTIKKKTAATPESEARVAQNPYAQAGSGAVPSLSKGAASKNDPVAVKRSKLAVAQIDTVITELQPKQVTIEIADVDSLADFTDFDAIGSMKMAGSDTLAKLPDGQKAPVILPDSSQDKTSRQGVFLKSITIALVVAPDITTVRFKDPDAVSANAGIVVSVPLTRRFRLVSGAVWANKLYNAAPEDYAPYPDFWNGKPLPNVIAAKCKVLDIPVNLQYKILERDKNILTVQAGLSSYIMLNEKYTYTYNHYGQDPYSKTREVSNENRHWFGIQNLSVGYTRKLSPVLSIGAEPFIKIPLSSIGAGNVKLTSAGVFFTAGYTFNKTP